MTNPLPIVDMGEPLQPYYDEATGLPDRATHIEWCKARARVYIAEGNFQTAYMSMMSDMGRTPNTVGDPAIADGQARMIAGLLDTEEGINDWLDTVQP